MRSHFQTLLIVILFSSVVSSTYSQYGNTTEMDILKAISTYRADLLSYDTEQTAKIGLILKQFKESGLSYDEISDLIFWMRYTIMSEYYDYSFVQNYIKKEFPNNTFLADIPNEYIDIVVANADIIDLVHFDILDLEYPFPVILDTSFMEELKFLNIESQDRIGEIAAGSGTFSTILSCIYPNITLFVNEISDERPKVIQQKLLHCNSIQKTNWVEVVKGKTGSTALEGKNLNKIIIRNAYHEFEKKEKMLKSIWHSLVGDGELILQEWDKAFYAEGETMGCPYYMTKNELLASLDENGFLLVDIFQDEKFLLMKFKKNPNYKP